MRLTFDPLDPTQHDPFCSCGDGDGGGSGGPGASAPGVDVEGIGAVGAASQGAATAANDAAAAGVAAANAADAPDFSSFEMGFSPNPTQGVTAPGNTVSGGPGTGAGIGVVDDQGNVHGFTGTPAVNDVSVAQAVSDAVAANPAGFAAVSPQATGLSFNPVNAVLNAFLGQAVPGATAVNVGLGIGNAMGLGVPGSIGAAVTDAVGMGTNADAGMGAGPGGEGGSASGGGGFDPAFVVPTTAQVSQPAPQTVAMPPVPKPVQMWNPYGGDPTRYGFGPEHGFKNPNLLDPAFFI